MKKIVSFLATFIIVCTLQAQIHIVDDFESYADFTINPSGQWTFIDNDNDSTYAISNVTFPNTMSEMAFIVFNSSMTTPSSVTSFPAHSGDKALACFASVSKPNDDWMISPQIGGNKVILTFWAKAATISYEERMKVGYSTTTNDMSSFTFVQGGNYVSVPDTWTKYSYIFPTGTQYIAINCVSDDAFIFFIDDIEITSPSTSIIAMEDSHDFGGLPQGSSKTTTIQIEGFNLSNDITASVGSPFELSADGNTYGSTATLDANGGLLYIKYTATTVGIETGNVILSSSGVNDTIALSGESKVCNIISSFPYEYGFERDQGEHICWQTIDANNDAQNGFGEFSFMDYTVGNGVAAHFYPIDSVAPTNDDWLISPIININTDLSASFTYLIGNNGQYYFPETFSVWAIHEDSTYADARLLVPSQVAENYLNFDTVDFDLRFLRGNYRIGIKVETPIHEYLLPVANYHYFIVDDFKVKEIIPSLTSTQSTLNLGEVAMGSSVETTLTFSAVNIPGMINVTVTAPFEVSYNGGAFGNSIQIQGEAELNYSKDLNIRINGTSVETVNGMLKISSANVEDTLKIALTAKVVDCSGVVTLPYNEGFENAWLPSACWSNLDVDNDGNFWGKHTVQADAHSGSACASSYSRLDSTSLSPNNYLITPKIRIPAQGATLSYWVAAQDVTKPLESYVVRVSTTSNATSDFSTIIKSDMLNRVQWINESISLNQFAGQDIYIAFIHTNVTNQSMLKLDDISITAGVGIADLPLDDSSISIHPNPAKEMLNISASSTINQVEIYSISGQLVYSLQANNQNLTINTSEYAQGLYIVKIYTENGIATKKVSIVK